MPAESPFVHLLGGPPPKALTDAQQSWAEWVQHHLVDVEAKVGHARYPQIHNTSVFIDDEGQVLGEYAKQNLWHPERYVLVEQRWAKHLPNSDYFVQGRRQNQVFETKFGRVGLLICQYAPKLYALTSLRLGHLASFGWARAFRPRS